MSLTVWEIIGSGGSWPRFAEQGERYGYGSQG
jgi:hypothetical protein